MVIFLIIPYLLNYVNVSQRLSFWISRPGRAPRRQKGQRAARDQKTLAHSWAPNLGSDRGAVVKSEAKNTKSFGKCDHHYSDDNIREKQKKSHKKSSKISQWPNVMILP